MNCSVPSSIMSSVIFRPKVGHIINYSPDVSALWCSQ